MRRIQKENDAYDECRESGKYVPVDTVDKELAESLYKQAKADWKETIEIEKIREKKTTNYSRLFLNRYDVMRMLIHALVIFDKIKPGDHKCIGAYLCVKHPTFLV